MPRTVTNDMKKCAHQMRVEMFMRSMRDANQSVPVMPTAPTLAVRKLRASLMLEECMETIQNGLGLDIGVSTDNGEVKFEFKEARPVNLIEVADGIADCDVVNIGTAAACGIAQEPCTELVDCNNLMKFAPGHSFREDGKLIKPKNHPAITAMLRAELIEQGAEF